MKNIPLIVIILLFPFFAGAQANRPPEADAGEPSIFITESSITLRGTATDPDGPADIVRVRWTQKSGPTTATLTNAGQLAVTVSGMRTGVYVFTFTVTDKATEAADDIRLEVRVELPSTLTLVPKKFFSPNGDGVNDTWDIKNLSLFPGYTVTVMDANGKKLFEKTSFTSDTVWDGASGWQGAYYYVVADQTMNAVQTGAFSLLW